MTDMLRNHIQEAEQGIIGGLLVNPETLAHLDLTTDDFLSPNHREMFDAILSVAKHQPVDLVTVGQHLESITGRNWLVTLSDMARSTPSATMVPEYAKILRDKARLVKAQNLLQEYKGRIATEGLPAIDNLASALMQLGMVGQSHEYSTTEMLRAVVNDLEARQAGDIASIPTGLVDVDHLLGGLHDSDLVVIAARPSVGKTAFLLNLMLNSNAAGGLISTEQPVTQIGQRLISREGRFAAARMRNPSDISDAHWAVITATVKKLQERNNIWINDNCGPTVADVVRQARKWKHAYGIKALFVDYIQRIKPADPTQPKHQQVGEITRALKDCARELNIPVVALAQVSRKVEDRADKRPHMGDISDSSEVEKEADQILTLYRDEVYNENSQDKGIMEVRVEKNRHGPTGAVRVYWQPEIMAVANLSREVA